MLARHNADPDNGVINLTLECKARPHDASPSCALPYPQMINSFGHHRLDIGQPFLH
jgi:hypothetical protein